MSEAWDAPHINPPMNLEAEQALLGAVLSNNEALERVADFLLPEHFADGSHQRIYTACCALVEEGTVANTLTLKGRFERDEGLTEVGGVRYLAKLQALGSMANVEQYGRVILDAYLRRSLIALAQETAAEAMDHTSGATDILERTEAALYDLAERRRDQRDTRALGGILPDLVDAIERRQEAGGRIEGLCTGFADLDQMTSGLEPGNLMILGARPGMGKTALALSIASRATISGDKARVLFFSLEMSARELAKRALVSLTGLSYFDLSAGRFDAFQKQDIRDAARTMDAWTVSIDDSPSHTAATIQTAARRWQRRSGLDLVIVDHLDFVESGRRDESTYARVSAAVRGLKQLAKRLGVPVLLLCQLSRNVERRDDKRPTLADLRDSGNIEQDADLVTFLYREHYYVSREEPELTGDREGDAAALADWQAKLDACRHRADLIIAKQRNGPTGTKRLYFDQERMTFDNWSDR